MALQDVPIELAEYILTLCHARDVARVAQTCKLFRALVYNTPDQYLWRELFLLYPFDDLRKAVPADAASVRRSSATAAHDGEDDLDDSAIDWRRALQRRVLAETIVVQGPGTVASDDLASAFATLVSVVRSALPYQPLALGQSSQPRSYNYIWLRDVLQRSPMIRIRDFPGPQHQHLCQLRAYLSLSLDEGPIHQSPHLQTIRSRSRCAVYQLSHYTVQNLWGPYHPVTSSFSTPSASPFTLASPAQPEVDWEHVEHIVNVVVMNMRELEETPYSLMRPQLGLESMRAYSALGMGELRERDWAGLEGLWRRFVCFMDYRELFAFNYSNLKSSLSPSYFDDPNFVEAVRLLEMRISLTSVDDPTELDYPGCPQLHFDGIVRGLQSRNALVKGFIQRFLDGTIRWKFETIYDGTPQWSAECIQLGNVCSAAGLAGIWSSVQHTDGDPAGPFLMWKIADPSWQDSGRDRR